MKNNIKRLLSLVALSLPLTAIAQTTLCNFETQDYDSLKVYDPYVQSAFNTGKLTGNVAVITNNVMTAGDSTAQCVALQRSRYGSNLFGAKIRLKTPFALTTASQYLHIMINKPYSGRVLVIGLGKRDDRPGESDQVEQFWSFSSTSVSPNEWYDAVCEIKGHGGITISSLLVIPDAENRLTETSDFVAYIDNIELSNSVSPRNKAGDYIVNFADNATHTRSNRVLSAIQLTGSINTTTQTINTNNTTSPYNLYTKLLSAQFQAQPGETVTPKFTYNSAWMCPYVYVDFQQDGKFTTAISNNVPTAGSDLKSYGFYSTDDSNSGYNSAGTAVNLSNIENSQSTSIMFKALPSFTIPATQKVGFYRMRYKVDWNNTDAGGRVTSTNDIISNGGAVVDVRLNVHNTTSKVTINNLNGQIYKGDSTTLSSVPFGKDLQILATPAPGFKLGSVTIKHGYLDGDSIIHSTPQWETATYPAYAFTNNRLTIPASVVDGDLEITGNFIEVKGSTTGDYPVNFDKNTLVINRTDRYAKNVTLTANGTTTTIPLSTTQPIKVFQDKTDSIAFVTNGSSIVPAAGYQGNSMHGYFYIDYNNDGLFTPEVGTDHKPTAGSELVSFSYLNGYNSTGATAVTNSVVNNIITLPAFTLPTNLPNGVYRARFKVDWNNSDPGGVYGSKYSSNYIQNNGGEVIDFLININNGTQSLKLITTDGNIYGPSNAALPTTVKAGTGATSLTFVPKAVATGFVLKSFTVKHGLRMDGDSILSGNRQWTLETIPVSANASTATYTLPAKKVDGDVIVTANFTNASSVYVKTFSDEFDAANGTGYNKSKWKSAVRYSSTWNRFITDTVATAFHQDGNMVLRTIPNLDKTKDNVAMLSGAIKSEGIYGFNHGLIECRAKTNPFSGNFPAFWLLPVDGTGGWPTAGEIDIFEQINATNTAYHTVHTNWTYTLGNKTNPTSSFNETVAQDRYHTYGLLKEDGLITWYVDGVAKGSYARSTDAATLSKGQWPFEKAFYIVLNQSVGDGSWAAAANTSHTYEFDVDWVRVYVKTTETGLTSAPQTVTSNKIYSVDGRLMSTTDVKSLPKGVYIVNGKKILVP